MEFIKAPCVVCFPICVSPLNKASLIFIIYPSIGFYPDDLSITTPLNMYICVTCNVPCNRCSYQQIVFYYQKFHFHYGQLTSDYGLSEFAYGRLTFHYGLDDILVSKISI